MSDNDWRETYSEDPVTYVFERQGQVIIIAHVPARVCVETGERLFAPDIVEQLQQIAWEQTKPVRVVQTPVFEFGQG
ncbi:MAG: YgiT-type zinc finger protein [Pseudomonadota bacterium]